MHGFVAGLRHRERHGLHCLGTYRRDGRPTVATETVRWKLNCETCDNFVLTGADLLYWRRNREQMAL